MTGKIHVTTELYLNYTQYCTESKYSSETTGTNRNRSETTGTNGNRSETTGTNGKRLRGQTVFGAK